MRKFLISQEINVIHAHDFKASIFSLILSLGLKIRVISHIHQEPIWLNEEKNIRFIFYQIFIKKFNHILVTSHNILKSKLFFGYDNVQVLYNYVTVNPSYTDSFEKKYDLIFLGRLEEIKNPFKFIELYEKLLYFNADISAVIVGNGLLFDRIVHYVQSNDLKVDVLGFREDPEKYLLKSRFYVNTSYSEGFGIALVEAMQLGVPVISFQNGGVSSYIDDSVNGILIDFAIENDDIRKINKFMKSSFLYDNLSIESRRLGMKFSDKNAWLKTLREIYYEN